MSGRMTPKEAQQAETIAGFTAEERALYDNAVICTRIELSEGSAFLIDKADELRDTLCNVLGLVDSQARKIEAMQKQLNAYSLLTEAAGSLMQKQYTKEELRECWEGKQAGYFNELKWRGFIECARFLGAIKEKEG